MSAAEDIIERVELPDLDDKVETKLRRRAKSIVHETLLSCKTPLENRGVGKRLLPGLWYAAMNILLACMERDEMLALLADRNRGIAGTADNADAPPKQISDKALPAYVEEVTTAGQTILEKLMEAHERLEAEGLEDRFPATVLDSSMLVLLSAWGPDHVRRAISEQAALLIQGIEEPVNFMEPSRYVTPPPDRGVVHGMQEAPQPVQAEVGTEPEETRVPVRRMVAARRADAFVHSDLADRGDAAWAVWIRTQDEDRQEERLIAGRIKDPNGRASWLKALHECVLAICEGAGSASCRIDTSSAVLVRAAENSPGMRFENERSVWADIDEACALHEIEFRHVPMDLTREPIERCDRAVRHLLEQN